MDKTLSLMKCLKYILLLFVASVFTTSCEDMLTPDNDRNTSAFAKDTMYSYWGILANMQKIAARNVIIGESRGDLVTTTNFVSDSVNLIAQYEVAENGSSTLLQVSDYYKVINMCNFYLQKVDTSRVIYNRKVMLREYAQVHFLRAWVYMKLVENYGSVPFLTEPIDMTNSKIENNTTLFVDRFTLRQKLFEAGLERALAIEKLEGLPNYGNYNTGAVTVNNLTTLFYGKLIVGDLYLLGAQSTADYEKAAQMYFDYMSEEGLRYGQFTVDNTANVGLLRVGSASGDNYRFLPSSYRRQFVSYGVSDNITQIPIAANTVFGNIVTDVARVYGFVPKITQHTDPVNDTTASTRGAISLTADYRARQLEPSPALLQLGDAQSYIYFDRQRDRFEAIPNLGDGRPVALAPFVATTAGNLRFVIKANTNGSTESDNFQTDSGFFPFHYAINVYRPQMVLLRYAEAINRAGFPGHAFALLRNGLGNVKNPRVAHVAHIARIDTIAPGEAFPKEPATINTSTDTIFDTTRVYTYEALSVASRTTGDSVTNISVNELLRAKGKPYFAFASFPELALPPLRSRGSGGAMRMAPDSLFSYRGLTQAKVDQENIRLAAYGETQIDTLAEHNFVRSIVAPADTSTIFIPAAVDPIMINAVEELLADEMALELAYEGTRFADLTRLAEHKNNAGLVNGTNWFAWKVSRRAEKLAPYALPLQKNEALYNKLTNKANWYLTLPRYY